MVGRADGRVALRVGGPAVGNDKLLLIFPSHRRMVSIPFCSFIGINVLVRTGISLQNQHFSPTRLAFGVLTVCLKESVGLRRAAGSPGGGGGWFPRLR